MVAVRDLVWLLTLAGSTLAMTAPPFFTLDLSAPAETRWRGSVTAILAEHGWNNSFGAVFAAHNATLFGNLSGAQFATLATALQSHFNERCAFFAFLY